MPHQAVGLAEATMPRIEYAEYVDRLRRLRDDDEVLQCVTTYDEFLVLVWYFELSDFALDEHIRAVWERRDIDLPAIGEVFIVDEEAERANELSDQFGFVRVDFDEDDDVCQPEWLFDRVIPSGGLYGNWSAAEGLGKSGLSQGVAVQMALGRAQLDEQGSAVPEARVLCLDYENPEGTYERRLRMMPYEGLRDVYRRLFYSRVGLGDIAPLDTYEGGQAVMHRALRCEADFVIIDTKTSSVEGRNNQDSTEYDFIATPSVH